MTGVSSVVCYGDPHGEWRPLLRACAEEPPDAIVIVGDCGLESPLHEQIAPIFAAGIRVRWIHGNHDTDNVDFHDRLWGDYPEGNLNAAWAQLGGLFFAGLGCIFKERV